MLVQNKARELKTEFPKTKCRREAGKKEEMKFRKKPVVIEAHRYLGPFSIDEMPGDFQDALRIEPSLRSEASNIKFYFIKTLEGNMHVSVGDWIIKGVKGEFYPCKPDIFEETHEKVD